MLLLGWSATNAPVTTTGLETLLKKLFLIVAALGALATPVLADGDVDAGGKIFKKYCFACHKVGDNAKKGVGPILNDLFGRTAGTSEDYKYSDAMIAAGEGGIVWDIDTLRAYLPKPREFVTGTKMTFVGLKKPEDIENLIAYLLTFSPDYVPAAD